MTASTPTPAPSSIGRARRVRERTLALAQPLSAEDTQAQAMPDASPVKWHLAHTSWFFDTFLLRPTGRACGPAWAGLYNSYYDSIDAVRPPRAGRGQLTRPGLAEILAYRRAVDSGLDASIGRGDADCALLELGLAHEEQHQELILSDILALFALNPLEPAYGPEPAPAHHAPPSTPAAWVEVAGGIRAIGHAGEGFAFDDEGPRHQVLLGPFRIASRPVTSGEWLAFMAEGGYRRPLLWQEDGFALATAQGWRAPAYWDFRDGRWTAFGLEGRSPVDEAEPVRHVSWWEADAFARWAGARLPTEAEWEAAAAEGRLAATGRVWEWTSSEHAPYPGWRRPAGALGEYNGKFMAGRKVLRGGSLASPEGHVRLTSRNFFEPSARWQFSGLRLAADP